MDSAFFSDLMASIAERGRSVLKLTAWPRDAANRADSLADMCAALLTGRGEASGLALASEILARYRALSDADKAGVLPRAGGRIRAGSEARGGCGRAVGGDRR